MYLKVRKFISITTAVSFDLHLFMRSGYESEHRNPVPLRYRSEPLKYRSRTSRSRPSSYIWVESRRCFW